MAVPYQAQFLQKFFVLAIFISVLYTGVFHYRYQQHSVSLETYEEEGSNFHQPIDEEDFQERKRAAILAMQLRNATQHAPLTNSPTKAPIISPTSPPTVSPKVKELQNQKTTNSSNTSIKHWRFDEVAPKIHNAKTHFLQSIPLKHRLPTDGSTANMTAYAANPQNHFPHKLHLFETNPCIAVLPEKYRDMFTINNSQPIYITVYRGTHKNNCYDGTINIQLLGGSWDPTITDYLGIALLDADLNILHETVVSFSPKTPKSPSIMPYDDYRIYNLRDDQLYLTSANKIVPLYLSTTDEKNSTKKELFKVPPAFPDASPQPSFHVYIRNFAACAIYNLQGTSKNMLYFVSHDGNTTDNNIARVIHYPRYNPNDVRVIELDTPCGTQPITPYNDTHNKEWYPDASYHTIDEEMFSNLQAPIWLRDRGSACCTQLANPTTNRTVFVAVVHPKTMFPGKKLPPGVAPNTYLSRWIAFEPAHPYRIVARSGMFCLGYPEETDGLGRNTSLKYQNPLATTRMNPLDFASVSINCPRIHFIMGMVDKIGEENSSVLISYGVSDCMSRIVEIRKVDIHYMLWPAT